MARGLQKAIGDVKQFFSNVASKANAFLDKPRGPSGISIKQAAAQTAPTVARDFGNLISGQNTIVSKIPVVKNVSRMAGNVAETVGSGVTDITRGAYRATIKPAQTLAGRLAGVAEAIYGGAKIASVNPANPAGKLYQVANVGTQIPDSTTQRISAGVMRGQTGIDTLAPDVKSKPQTYKVAGQEFTFDPVETLAKMYGFTRNPVNAKIFAKTEGINLIPGAKTITQKAANFILTNVTRGGAENILMSIKDLPDNASKKEKAEFLRNEFLMGAASELIFRGGSEALQKTMASALARLSDSKLSQVFDLVRGKVKEVEPPKAISETQKLIDRIARDPKAKLAELPDRIRKAVLDYRFENKIEAEPKRMLFRDETNPDTATIKLIRDGRQIRRTGERAYGMVAGLEPEYDEEGKLKGFGYNPVKGVAGLAITDPQIRKIVEDTIKPKTALLEKANEIEGIGRQALEEARIGADVAKETRAQFSDDMIKDINRVKTMVRSKSGAEGDIETLRKKDSKLIERVVEAVRENPMYESLSDDEALAKALEIPTKAETIVSTPDEIKQARELRKQANEIYDSVYNSETDPRVNEMLIKNNQKALERAADDDFREWQKAVVKQESASEGERFIRNLDTITRSIEDNTAPAFVKDVEKLKDISSMSRGWRDLFRNMKQVFGDSYKQVKDQILDPFDASKRRFVDSLERHADELDANIVKGLGIKKGSKESAAVQQFGEGNITQEQLVKEFGPETANKIIEADKWFRGQYDTLLDEVNAMRARIYPNRPDKLVPKRSDYYRHFQEMAEGIQGLKNIFETPANISSSLAGTSEYTKPKSKWASFMQRRLGNKTTEDAVGGYLDYVKAAEYSKNIDPEIEKFRQLRQELIEKTADTLPDGTANPNAGKLNNTIEFLDDFANDLAGKTNPVDRALTKLGLSRKGLRVLDWLNSRVKANMILGNLSSSIAQFFNVPQGLAEAGPKYSATGLKNALVDAFSENKVIDQSSFIKERYSGSVFDRFDEGILADAKKFAVWITGALDEAGTKLIWRANYDKALAEGIENPVKYADDIAREMVAGRGIGEVPLAQKSKVVQLGLPFQLEVGNLWHVMKGWADQKETKKFLYFAALSFIMNRTAKAVRGSDVSFDPINSLAEAIQEYQDEPNKAVGATKAVGRIAGEVFSNIPGGQTIASLVPETGFKVGGETVTRSELFGEGDPTRFGGGLIAMKGLQDPLFKILPGYGGAQIKRTIEGAQALAQGGVKNKGGQLQYALDSDLPSVLQTLAFGKYSTGNARFYFDEELSPLSEKQTKIWQNAVDQGQDPVKAWAALYRAKLVQGLPSKMVQIARDPNIPQDQKRKAIVALKDQYDELNDRLEKIGKLGMLGIGGEKETPSIKVNASTPAPSPSQTVKVKVKKPTLSIPKLKIKKPSGSPAQTIKLKRVAPTVESFMR